MSADKTGGPAFPRPMGSVGHEAYNRSQTGMTLRDYFIAHAAHAPVEPRPWFRPFLTPYPDKDPKWVFCVGCRAGIDCDEDADCAKLVAWKVGRDAHSGEWERQRDIQWPAAWADYMIAERERAAG